MWCWHWGIDVSEFPTLIFPGLWYEEWGRQVPNSTQLQGGLEEPAKSRWEGGAGGKSGSTDSGVNGGDRERRGWNMAWGRDERGALVQLKACKEKQGLLESFWEQVDNRSLGKAGMKEALLPGTGTGWAEMWSWSKGRLVGGRLGRVPRSGSSAPLFCPASPYFSPFHLCAHPHFPHTLPWFPYNPAFAKKPVG